MNIYKHKVTISIAIYFYDKPTYIHKRRISIQCVHFCEYVHRLRRNKLSDLDYSKDVCGRQNIKLGIPKWPTKIVYG